MKIAMHISYIALLMGQPKFYSLDVLSHATIINGKKNTLSIAKKVKDHMILISWWVPNDNHMNSK